MTTTRTCVPEFVIRFLEDFKKNNDWPETPFDETNPWFSLMFREVTGFDKFYPRCKMAYNHPDMRLILEM